MTSNFDVPVESQIKYLRRRKEELARIEAELVVPKFDLAKKVGHQIKGNAITFKLPALEAFAIRLEEAALAQDASAVRKEVLALESLVENFLKELA